MAESDVTKIVVAAVGVLLLIWVIWTYNRLTRRLNQIEAAWGQVDVQLQRRHELVPNLIATVEGYAAHERSTLEAVIRARNDALGAEGQSQRAEAEAGLTKALHGIFALAESYPQLRASANYLAMQGELAESENRIAYGRQFYNDSVLGYQHLRRVFPNNIVAFLLRFRPREYFRTIGEARNAPMVRFAGSR